MWVWEECIGRKIKFLEMLSRSPWKLFLGNTAILAHREGNGPSFTLLKKAMIHRNHFNITFPSLHISGIKSDY